MLNGTKIPYAGKEPRKIYGPSNGTPVSNEAEVDAEARKGTALAETAALAGDGIPDFLKVKNREPVTSEVAARAAAMVAEAAAKPAVETEAAAKVAEEMANLKKERNAVKKERKAAEASGATKAMPLEGKAALAAIKGAGKGKLPVPPPKSKKSVKAPKVNLRQLRLSRLAKRTAKATAAAEAKAAKPAAKPSPVSAAGGNRAGTKAELIGGLLRRPEGCTAAEVMTAANWPSVSMPAQAKACGLTLRKEKVPGSPTRYYGS